MYVDYPESKVNQEKAVFFLLCVLLLLGYLQSSFSLFNMFLVLLRLLA
jgi:hypothetical protein